MPRVVVISPEAGRVMLREFRKRTPAFIVATLVMKETGEVVTPRTVARRAADFRAEQLRVRAAREQMTALVEASTAGDFTSEEMLRALAFQSLLEDPKSMQADAVALQKLRIKEKAVDLKARQIAVEEGKLKLLLDREQRAIAALAPKDGETVTPEERLERIRAIYGLRQQNN